MMDSLDAGVAAVFRTVITGEQDQIQQAINNYKDPNGYDHLYFLYQKKDGDGRNLLHYVCMYNTDEVATWMLSLRDHYTTSGRPIPKDSDKFGVTAVMYAARAEMVTFVTEWIKQKCDINTVDKNGRNILHYCCGGGDVIPNQPDTKQNVNIIDKKPVQEIVQLLVIHGVDCSCVDKTGISPIRHFLDRKLDKWSKWIVSDTSRAMKIWRNDSHVTKGMLSERQMYPRVIIETTSLQVLGGFMHICTKDCFIKNPKLSFKQRLINFEKTVLSCKLNVNEIDDNGMTALHYLYYCQFGNEPYGLRRALIPKLLELGANPDITDIMGYTPLMCALEKGFVELYQPNDQTSANEQGMGNLLNAKSQILPRLDLCAPHTEAETILMKQVQSLTSRMKAQEDIFRKELERFNKQFIEQQTDTTISFNKKIASLLVSKEELENAYGKLQKTLDEKHKQLTERHCKENKDMSSTLEELKQNLEERCKEIDDLKSQVKRCHGRNVELKNSMDERCKGIDDLKLRVEAFQDTNDELKQNMDDLKSEVKCLQQRNNESQQNLEEQYEEIKTLKSKLEKEQIPTLSLILGNLKLPDVCCHLDADVEVTYLPDAGLDELEASVTTDEQKYKNIYLITENKSTRSDFNNLILQYRKLIDASKDKATKLIVASVLPTLDDGDVNDNIEQLNKELEALCQQTGCQFVNNDSKFKFMDGTIVEQCFAEGPNLSEFGIKQLLKNLGLFITKNTRQATNI